MSARVDGPLPALRSTGVEVKHLRRLVEIADRGDVAAAARALGVPVAQLESQLRHLERQIGGPVFDLLPGGLVPTLRGTPLVETARSVLADLALLTAEATEPRDAVLRVAGVDTLLRPTMSGLVEARPEAAVTSRATDTQAAIELVRDGAADIAVTVRWPHVDWPRSPSVAQRTVGRQLMYLLLPAGHRLAGRGLLDLSDLDGETWCVRTDPDAAASVVAECRRSGFEPDIRYRLSSEAELLDVVAAGRAVAITAHPVPATDGIASARYRGAAAGDWIVAWPAEAATTAVGDAVAAVERWCARRGWPEAADPRPDEPGTPRRALVVGATADLAGRVELPRLRTVHGLHVRVRTLDGADLLAALEEGSVDLALCHSHPFLPERLPAGWPRLVVVADEPLLIAVSVDTDLAPVPLARLATAAWAAPASPEGAAVLRGLGHLGGFEPRILARYDDPDEVADAVAAGELLRLAEPDMRPGCAVLVPVEHPDARRTTVLAWPPDHPVASLAEVVARELRRSRPVPPSGWTGRWQRRAG